MYFYGGLGLDTKVMCYEKGIHGETCFSLEKAIGRAGIDSFKMVSFNNLYGEYDLRFSPVWVAVRSVSQYNVKLIFEDDSEVICNSLQKFLMGDCTWKEAKSITAEDTFTQIARNMRVAEFEGDYRNDESDFEMAYVGDVPKMKLRSLEYLPTTKALPMAVPVDWHKDNIVLANGLVVEGVCISDEISNAEW